MNIRKGDQVKILSGKDRGKSGKILSVNSKLGRAVVEGLNIFVKHQRPKKQGEKGQKIHFPRALNLSNIMLVCPHCKKTTRVAAKTDEKGVKYRVCKNCGKRV